MFFTTKKEVEYALSCLEESPDFVLIPTIHPGSPPGFIRQCESRISKFKYPDRIRHLKGVSSDHIAALADITFGTHETGIRVACYNDRTLILTWSKDIGSLLKDDVGTSHYVMSEVTIEITGNNIKPFSQLLKEDGSLLIKRQKFIGSPPLFSAGNALEAILNIFQTN